MIIQIDERNRIVGKERCWELQRLRKNGKRWEAFKWFTTFRQALDEAVHSEIRLHPAQSVSEAIEAVSAIVRRISALIPSGYRPDR